MVSSASRFGSNGYAVIGQPAPGRPTMPPLHPAQPVRSAEELAELHARREWFELEQRRLLWWARLRTTLLHRLVGMNVRHGMHAWQERHNRPVSPWAVGFLYAYTLHNVGHIAAATRLFVEEEDEPGPAQLLFRVADLADARLRNESGVVDPTPWCTHLDDVGAPAQYVGVALSCLGTMDEPWDQLRRGDSDDFPGHAYAWLMDGTGLMFTRTTRRQLRHITIHTTASVEHQDHLAADRNWLSNENVLEFPGSDPDVWHQLYRLHVLLGSQQPLPALQPTSGRQA
jgi:hypothetical protein